MDGGTWAFLSTVSVPGKKKDRKRKNRKGDHLQTAGHFDGFTFVWEADGFLEVFDILKARKRTKRWFRQPEHGRGRAPGIFEYFPGFAQTDETAQDRLSAKFEFGRRFSKYQGRGGDPTTSGNGKSSPGLLLRYHAEMVGSAPAFRKKTTRIEQLTEEISQKFSHGPRVSLTPFYLGTKQATRITFEEFGTRPGEDRKAFAFNEHALFPDVGRTQRGAFK